MSGPESIRLGVNIDHIATVRQARGTRYPDPVQAGFEAELAGADGITVHLREDRRHIQDRDVEILSATLQTRMNLEIAATEEMLRFAERIQPGEVCLVPERREELTTEGGLDVAGQRDRLIEVCARLGEAGIRVSLFVDPDPAQITVAAECGAPIIEIHTGRYAEMAHGPERKRELDIVRAAVAHGLGAGLQVNAGHGLTYDNVQPIAAIQGVTELNIGHAIIARALFTGMREAVSEMKRLMVSARS